MLNVVHVGHCRDINLLETWSKLTHFDSFVTCSVAQISKSPQHVYERHKQYYNNKHQPD